MSVRSRILSGVSLISMLAAAGAVGTATAADTISGPAVYDPYVNAETDTVTINLDATVEADENNDSFINLIPMNAAGSILTIDDSYLLGDIVNHGSMVSTGSNGIDIVNDSQVDGGILNTGLIDAEVGIFIDDDSTVAGGILNEGSIVAVSTAILVGDDSEIIGGVTNTGLIEGALGINVSDAQAELRGGITNAATGTIGGTTTAAIEFSGAILTGGITNDGLIQGDNAANGINLLAGTITGGITNNETGVIQVLGSTVTAVLIDGATFNGNVTNNGQILAEGTSALGVVISGTTAFTGNVTNSATGTISADTTALLINNVTFTGNVSNAGEITSADGDGVDISATTFTGNFTNEAGGEITGGSDGVYLGGTTFTGNILNDGDITALSSTGIFIATTNVTGNVTNNGVIAATSGNGIVVTAASTLTGNITNSATGTISALTYGIAIDGTVTGTVTNAGIIDPSYGINVTGQVNGGIVNSGTILATIAGIDLTGANAAHTITQSAGLIQGRSADDLTTTVALDLDQSGAEFDDTVNLNGGEIDGNIDGGGADDVIVGGDVALRRGTVDALDQFDVDTGRVLLGAQVRGEDGEGLAVTNVNSMTVTAGSVYLDDDTTVDLVNDYTQGGEGAVEFFLTTDTTTHGQINAGGDANLDGALIAVVDGADFGSLGGDTFTYEDIITGAIVGTFTNVSTSSIFFEAEADYAANHVDLILERQGFADALILPGLTQNQQSIGGALEDIYDGGVFGPDFEDLFNHLLSLPVGSEEDVAHIYDELAGAEHADIQEIGLRVSHAFTDAIGERMDDMKAAAGGSKSAGLGLRRYADAGTSANDGEPVRRHHSAQERMGISVWGRGYGAWTNADGDAEAAGYDQDTGGVAGGIDVAVDHNWNVGGAVGWSTSDVEFATAGDEADVDGFQFAGYAAYESGRYYGDAIVSFGFNDVTSTRLIELGFDDFIANANYDSNTFGVHGEFGATFDGGRVDVTPFIAVGYMSNSTDGFSETGAGDFGLVVADSDADSLTSTLGMRFSGAWQAGGVRLVPKTEVAWRHEFLDERQGFSAAFLEDPSTPFSIVSSSLSRDSALVNAGVGAQVSRNFVLFLDYNGVLNSTANTHTASAGLRATW